MCLALPARIVEIHNDDSATVSLGGVRKQVSTALIEEPAVGDYVIVHVGYALSRLDPAEAERTLALLAALEQSPPGQEPEQEPEQEDAAA
ncbi:HypC/HybG/HupF family hydrogenase formation chaperone [Skermanella sp. TT6]|uniref:HypC/HybG/HupF family hydrogenase formation chaperone n=1 Tax=Skermanella cutis TaxID=2775420 RepID=A0ABX7B9K4_9PROT|nr:HypC/HybG/HupF family hydrogenase formation chaperone [Skermanella sp. TT6]QQP91042.1 HypC/HybG/HupF family hydrogenase formation chaperone [Skermanella sp. TT6]